MWKTSQRISYKICIFGDGGVGKTTLINRYVQGIFTTNTTMTIGVDFHIKVLDIEGIEVRLQIWDFAGEERFRFMLPAYVKGAAGGIFVYDITRYSSLRNINDWSEVIDICTDENTRPLPVILVGSKLDLEFKRAIEQNYGNQLVESGELFIDYIECSSKTGLNVEKIFTNLAQEMMKRQGLI
jgi:small GTP-binding protein